MRVLSILVLAGLLLTSCSAPETQVVVEPTVGITPESTCTLEPVVVPTPADTPGYAQLDETTGLHYTGTYVDFDFDAWTLVVEGEVNQPLSLTYDEIRCMDKVEQDPVLVCPGFFEDHFSWSGVRLADVLALADPTEDATTIRIFGRDGYSQKITLETAMAETSLLAWEWEDQILPAIHGFPLRAVFPDEQGNKWVKWIERIRVE